MCYLLPFAFFFGPALLAEGSAWEIGSTALTGVFGVACLAAAIVGYLRGPLTLAGRAFMAVAGIGLLDQGFGTDLIGVAVGGAWLSYAELMDRRSA